ncbi:MAG: hypothetical protein LAT81_14735 [Oceanicaulis sp.]|nr:hypothetical protein [Oceanicaulis sp.]
MGGMFRSKVNKKVLGAISASVILTVIIGSYFLLPGLGLLRADGQNGLSADAVEPSGNQYTYLLPGQVDHYAHLKKMGGDIDSCNEVRRLYAVGARDVPVDYATGRILWLKEIDTGVMGGSLQIDNGQNLLFFASVETMERAGTVRRLEGAGVCIAGLGLPEDGFVMVAVAIDR